MEKQFQNHARGRKVFYNGRPTIYMKNQRLILELRRIIVDVSTLTDECFMASRSDGTLIVVLVLTEPPRTEPHDRLPVIAKPEQSDAELRLFFSSKLHTQKMNTVRYIPVTF